MKIYTGTGDRGRTGLLSGERVSKSHPRVRAYGSLDELNSTLGVLISMLPESAGTVAESLQRIQSDLFYAGAWLARTPGADSGRHLIPLDEGRAGTLEKAIDAMEQELYPLNGFILPGGHPSGAFAHLARTVCRRVERRLAALQEEGDRSLDAPTDAALKHIIIYFNRLSDYLFVLARHLNQLAGAPEISWRQQASNA